MRKSGLTLIELVLTIAIIVLLAFLLVPKLMNRTPRLAVEAEAVRIRADLQYAQQLAIARNAPCRVVFEQGTDRVIIMQSVDGSFETVSKRQLPDTVTLMNTTLTANTITFDELGEPDRGGQVKLLGPGPSLVTVTIEPGTGFVTVVSSGREL
jgi:Tfp pilus assembly protein FimT